MEEKEVTGTGYMARISSTCSVPIQDRAGTGGCFQHLSVERDMVRDDTGLYSFVGHPLATSRLDDSTLEPASGLICRALVHFGHLRG